MMDKLNSHSQIQTASRYAHFARHCAKAAAEMVADSFAVYVGRPPRTPFTM